MLHAVAGEDFDFAAIIQLDGNVDRDFAGALLRTLHMPSSRRRRAAASSKRMAAEVQDLFPRQGSGVVATIYHLVPVIAQKSRETGKLNGRHHATA